MSGKQRSIRKRSANSEEAEEQAEECARDNLEEVKLLQRQRKRTQGIPGAAGVGGGARGQEDGSTGRKGDSMMDAYVKEKRVAVNEEDLHMQKFIEEELQKRLGREVTTDDGLTAAERKLQDEEQELYKVPDSMKSALTQDVTIPGLITGITEVALPMDVRLKNIEETEAFKSRLLGGPGSMSADADHSSGAPGPTLRRGMYPPSFGKSRMDKKGPETKGPPPRIIKAPRMSKGS